MPRHAVMLHMTVFGAAACRCWQQPHGLKLGCKALGLHQLADSALWPLLQCPLHQINLQRSEINLRVWQGRSCQAVARLFIGVCLHMYVARIMKG